MSEPAATGAVGADSGAAGGASGAPAAAGAGAGAGTGIPALDKAISALPIEDRVVEQHPEFLVGGAFAAGFLLARLLKAIGG